MPMHGGELDGQRDKTQTPERVYPLSGTSPSPWSRFVATHSPEHLEWSTQIQTVHLKKCALAPVSYLEKEEMQTLLT
jgi:hypothetical protein